MASTSLTPAVRDLLAAIRDALDVPLAALEDIHNETRLTIRRANEVRALATILVRETDETAIVRELARFRGRIADMPVTYRLYGPERPEGGNLKLPPTQPQVASSVARAEAADVR